MGKNTLLFTKIPVVITEKKTQNEIKYKFSRIVKSKGCFSHFSLFRFCVVVYATCNNGHCVWCVWTSSNGNGHPKANRRKICIETVPIAVNSSVTISIGCFIYILLLFLSEYRVEMLGSHSSCSNPIVCV